MWSQLLLSKFTRPLLTHQSQEAIIIPSLYRTPFLPRKLQSSLLTLRLCSCQERNVAPLTSKGGSEAHGEPLTHSGHALLHPPLLPLYQSPHPKLWFGGKKTGEAAVVPSCFHPSPAQANVLMTGVTRCNVVGQVIISVIGINSSQTHKVMSFTVGKTVLG